MNMKRSSYLLETAFGLGAVALAGILTGQGPGMVSLKLHPYWLIVLLIAVRYGSREGTLAGALCALSFSVFSLGRLSGESGSIRLHSAELYMSLGFVVAGFLFGEIRSVQQTRSHGLEKRLKEAERSLQAVTGKLEISEKAKATLERKIYGQVSTLKTLYECSRKLETLDEKELLRSIPGLLCTHLRARCAAVYIIRRRVLTLLSREGSDESLALQNRMSLEDDPLFARAFRERRIVNIRDMATREPPGTPSGRSLVCGPVLDGQGRPVALVSIHAIDFLDLGKSTIKMFSMILEWSSEAYQKAVRFGELTRRSVRNEELGVYRLEYFKEALAHMCDRSRRFGIPLGAFLFRVDYLEEIAPAVRKNVLRTVALTLTKTLRVIDLVAEYHKEGWFAVVVNTNRPEDTAVVRARLLAAIDAYRIKPYGDERLLSVSVGEACYDSSIAGPNDLLRKAEESMPGGDGRIASRRRRVRSDG